MTCSNSSSVSMLNINATPRMGNLAFRIRSVPTSLGAPTNEFSHSICPAGPYLPPSDLRKRVATADAVEEAEGVADVALAAGVGPYDYREGANF